MTSEGYRPPGVMESLSAGWKAYKSNFWLVFGSSVLLMFVEQIPVLGLVGMAGRYKIALKAIRGEKAELNDAFVGFQKITDYLLIGLLAVSGLLLCGFGAIVTFPLFSHGIFFILEDGMTWREAKDRCMKLIWPNVASWALFNFAVNFIVLSSGFLLCIIGIYLTFPLMALASAYAYEHARRQNQPLATVEEGAVV